MTDGEILERLGRIIAEYFDEIKGQDEGYNLLVDEYLFDYFLERLEEKQKISRRRVFYALRDVKCNFHGNKYEALAIASYQVSIFYQLGSDTSQDAYTKKLISSEAYSNLHYPHDYWYQDTPRTAPEEGCAYQEKLWALLKKEFGIKDIPEPKAFHASGRYVQYPKSQNKLGEQPRTFRIKYVDKFIQLGLEPNMGITYEMFDELVFNGSMKPDFIKRLVFSLYGMWDGRSFNEIEKRIKVSAKERELQARNECFIQVEPEPKIFINRKELEIQKNRIPDVYLWGFSEFSDVAIHKGAYFIEDEEGYDDWLPTRRLINPEDSEERVLIVANLGKLPHFIESAIAKGDVQKVKLGYYTILILEFKSRAEFEKIGIPLKRKPVFKLTGGLKVNGNTYYSFALPTVQLTEGQDKAKYKHVFIDSKKYPLSDGFFKIPEADAFSEGEHVVKLTDSWNSSKLCFKIKKASDADIPAEHGWKLDYEGKSYAPSRSAPETVIDGLRLLTKLNWIERKKAAVFSTITNSTNLRNFEEQQERLLFRFEHTGNMAISQRRKYGN